MAKGRHRGLGGQLPQTAPPGSATGAMTYEIRRVRVEEYAYCVNKLRNVGLET